MDKYGISRKRFRGGSAERVDEGDTSDRRAESSKRSRLIGRLSFGNKEDERIRSVEGSPERICRCCRKCSRQPAKQFREQSTQTDRDTTGKLDTDFKRRHGRAPAVCTVTVEMDELMCPDYRFTCSEAFPIQFVVRKAVRDRNCHISMYEYRVLVDDSTTAVGVNTLQRVFVRDGMLLRLIKVEVEKDESKDAESRFVHRQEGESRQYHQERVRNSQFRVDPAKNKIEPVEIDNSKRRISTSLHLRLG